jgi:large subunit ribosomal protein L9
MKIILQESYMSLGEAGDVVDVRPGYARNFLIPQKIAVTATKANVKKFEDKAKEFEIKKTSERENSKKLVGVLEGIKLTLKVKVSDDGKLYGAISTKQIESELAKAGANVDRRQIVLGKQIKMVGDYSILVRLVGGMKAMIPLTVMSDAQPKQGEMPQTEKPDAES